MQWLIDIIVEAVLARFKNIISEWHGLLVDIPDGWVLCDGNNGTPDLRNRFTFAVGTQPGMNQTGGVSSHNHPFTSNSHNHDIPLDVTADGVTEGNDVCGSVQGPPPTESVIVTGTTDNATNIPPYYTLAYIMKT